MPNTVLFVDDHGYSYGTLVAWLQDQDVDLVIETNATRGFRRALDLHEKGELDLILLDVIMPKGEEVNDEIDERKAGIRMAQMLRERGVTAPILFWTVASDEEIQETAETVPRSIVIPKGPPRIIADKIRQCLEGNLEL